MITETTAKKVLTYHQDPFPTHWDVNPYRGCTIGCRYCFAQYTHKYLGKSSFFKDIFVKTNVASCLKKEISGKNWTKEQIKLGGTTDLYQHIEKKYELVPQMLKVIQQHRNPVFMQTKSTLMLRDFDQISQAAQYVEIDIATSVTAFDESIRRKIEPGASSTSERIAMLGKFKGNCRTTILGIMPIIPFLTDGEENLEKIFALAKENEVDHVVTSFLFLRGEVKKSFLDEIAVTFPEVLSDITSLYRKDYPPETYLLPKQKLLMALMDKYGFNETFIPVTPKAKYVQTSLF